MMFTPGIFCKTSSPRPGGIYAPPGVEQGTVDIFDFFTITGGSGPPAYALSEEPRNPYPYINKESNGFRVYLVNDFGSAYVFSNPGITISSVTAGDIGIPASTPFNFYVGLSFASPNGPEVQHNITLNIGTPTTTQQLSFTGTDYTFTRFIPSIAPSTQIVISLSSTNPSGPYVPSSPAPFISTAFIGYKLL